MSNFSDFEIEYAKEGLQADAWGKENKITLKRIAIFDRHSQETTCFSAVIVQDGWEIGTVDNDGNGSPDCISAKNGGSKEILYHTHMERCVDNLLLVYRKQTDREKLIKSLKRSAKKAGYPLIAFCDRGDRVAHMQGMHREGLERAIAKTADAQNWVLMEVLA
jgi:hypothetical protein